jgi:hypothetical protein
MWHRISLQNRSNFDAHFTGTGPEIWRQTNGEISGFVAGAGQSAAVISGHCLMPTFLKGPVVQLQAQANFLNQWRMTSS